MGGKARFFPLTEEQANAEIETLLHCSPSAYGLNRAGWRLQDVQQALNWLEGYSKSGIYKVLKQLGVSH